MPSAKALCPASTLQGNSAASLQQMRKGCWGGGGAARFPMHTRTTEWGGGKCFQSEAGRQPDGLLPSKDKRDPAPFWDLLATHPSPHGPDQKQKSPLSPEHWPPSQLLQRRQAEGGVAGKGSFHLLSPFPPGQVINIPHPPQLRLGCGGCGGSEGAALRAWCQRGRGNGRSPPG